MFKGKVQRAIDYLQKNGMRTISRFVIVMFCFFVVILNIYLESFSKNPSGLYVLIFFCLLISLAVLTKGRACQFFCSLIGCMVFVAAVAYLYNMLCSGQVTAARKGDLSIFKAIGFMIFFGMPAIFYAYKVKFGFANLHEDHFFDEYDDEYSDERDDNYSE